MTGRRGITFGAIPVNDDGREMLGTHGSVTSNGRHVLTHVVSGEYASRENFIRHTVHAFGTDGVTYAIYAGGFGSSGRKIGTVVARKALAATVREPVPRYVGMWHGGNGYAAPYADDAEWFGSIRQAVNAVWFRQTNGGHSRATFRYVFRDRDLVYVPGAHDDNSGGIALFRVSPEMSPDDIREMIERDGYPDRLVEFGPRGGIIVTRT